MGWSFWDLDDVIETNFGNFSYNFTTAFYGIFETLEQFFLNFNPTNIESVWTTEYQLVESCEK